ncbi:uncharacterized protein LOC124895949 [Capsicum annuum]|uniref:uncharacterized protein LOC124895949 n=1 Tax=Capsicum annuum TaxID=4072 RepID=UPI001FB0F1DA|nr:uncharacterized protein LOC124895949 [Capsicum annuum]
MNQQGCSRNNQKTKNFLSAGSLASLRNKQILEHKKKKNTGYINSKEKNQKQKEKSNNVSPMSQVPEQVQQVQAISQVLKQVQHVSPNSTSLAAPVEEQVRQELLDSTIRASQPIVEQVRKDQSQLPNLQANEQSREGLSTNKRKRGATQMQAVHGRTDRQLIVLNELNSLLVQLK